MKNHFAVERNGKCIDNLVLENLDGSVAFTDLMETSYNEMKANKDLDAFVSAIMEASDGFFEDSSETVVTLVGEDGVFIWGILMGFVEDTLNYALIDWQKDGHQYRYEN